MSEILISILKRSLLIVKKSDISFCLRGIRQGILRSPRQYLVKTENTTEAQAFEQVTTNSANGKGMRNELLTILKIKEFEALKLLSSYKKLFHTPSSLISKNLKICTENNLTKQIILKYPFLLCESNLTKKISRLEKLPINLYSSIPLAKLSMRRLYSILLNDSESIKRIQDLCAIFNVSLGRACVILSKKSFLFSKPFNELKQLLDTFYEYGFTKEDVLNDLWIFKYSETFIRSRLDFVKKCDIVCLKTWMIRCSEEILYKHIKRESDNRDILGENSVAQYLSEKLKCSENVAKSLIRKHPQLQNKSLRNMNVMIDLLYREGFTPTQICRVPKVLLHSNKTTEQRLKQLITLGKKPDSLYILTKSQRQYLQHIENLIKA